MKVLIPNPIPTEVQPFARASTGTYIDNDGVLQTAGVNVPRFQDGALLVEPAATNLLTQSNRLWDSTAWDVGFSLAGFYSVTESTAVSDPTGTGASVARFVASASTDALFLRKPITISPGAYAPSIWLYVPAQAGLNSWQIQCDAGDADFSMPSASQPIGQWVCVKVPALTVSAIRGFLDFNIQDNGAPPSPGFTFYATTAQFEAGATHTSSIPTTTAPATRAADIVASTGIVASNTVEAYPPWEIGTPYAKDDRVDYGIDIYQSLVNSNTGNQPDTSPLSWALVGPDNKHAMFDNEIATVTTSPAPLSVTVATGVMDAVYLGNVTAARATVTVQNGAGGPVVYQSTQSLAGDEVADWYQYFFFDPLTQRTQAFFQGIPLVLNSYLTIELDGAGTVSIGTVSFGRLRTLGTVVMGAQAGIRDYSRKETDEFGKTFFVKRDFSKRLSAQFAVDRAQLNRVQRQLYDLRATPVVWLGADDAPEYEEALTIFGFYRDFTTAIDYPTYSLCNIEIEGLI